MSPSGTSALALEPIQPLAQRGGWKVMLAVQLIPRKHWRFTCTRRQSLLVGCIDNFCVSFTLNWSYGLRVSVNCLNGPSLNIQAVSQPNPSKSTQSWGVAPHSFSSLSYDRSKASSKSSSPHSAIQSFLFQMRVSSPFLKVI